MITGDHPDTAKEIASQVGIDNVIARVLPGDKRNRVIELQKKDVVAMVGDGINDAPALKKADVSISLRGATSAAVDTAQIILMDGSMSNLPGLFDAAEDFASAQKSNLALTIVPAVICIGGVFAFHFGIYTSQLLFFSGLAAGIWNANRGAENFSEPERFQESPPAGLSTAAGEVSG